jgi:hypothetical protein
MSSNDEQQMAALKRLWEIANGHSGQCRIVAKFLLGLYNGDRFPFDLTDFRSLDRAIFKDCLQVLEMDYQPAMEIHQLMGMVNGEFEQLAARWGMTDRSES